MTPHPNAEYLRALADGKRVMVQFGTHDCCPFEDCSTTVQMSLLRPGTTPQARWWSFHIEQEDSHE